MKRNTQKKNFKQNDSIFHAVQLTFWKLFYTEPLEKNTEKSLNLNPLFPGIKNFTRHEKKLNGKKLQNSGFFQ